MNEVRAVDRIGRGRAIVVGLSALVAFVILIGLGTWQVQRLHWKEGLLAEIDQRIHSTPRPLAEVERTFAETGDVSYLPVKLSGTFLHQDERHVLSTWEGASGFNVFTPLELDDGRLVFVNRGFVPYERKDPATRPEGQVGGKVEITGLARDPVPVKPSVLVPDNDVAKNIFYWKDLEAMKNSADIPADREVLPFFVDAGPAPNPGGLPIGGVTIIDLPNNHLQYAITWYGLAAALVAVLVAWFWRSRQAGPETVERPDES